MSYLLEILMSMSASCGFAVVFQIKPRHLKYIALGGLLSWGSYLLFLELTANRMAAMFAAAIAVTAYAEIGARIDKVPSTLIYIPTIIPLIPGSYLYYCTSGLIAGDNKAFEANAALFMQDAMAIVLGTVLVYTLVSLLIHHRKHSDNHQGGI